MDHRFKKINSLLSAYALGQFDKKIPLSKKLDEVDAFIAGVNMLGEELKETTISRNYFNDIFNSVSDMVFVLDHRRKITNINKAVTDLQGLTLPALKGKNINDIFPKPLFPDNDLLKKNQKSRELAVQTEAVFITKNNKKIPVLLTIAGFKIKESTKPGFIVTAKDITNKKESENLIIRTITETQEKERQRFAKDVHDSMGQQLSAIKFYISTISSLTDDNKLTAILAKANNALLDVHFNMRSICFNLMPQTLESFGLLKAVEELCNQLSLTDHLSFIITGDKNFLLSNKSQEIAIFRIIQEFINNTLKHGNAGRIFINFKKYKTNLKIILKDNGIGFKLFEKKETGMGLRNVQSRIASYNGEIKITSSPGEGTKYEILLPLTDL
jgi:PAS domain S-box-containing protein